jgi:hypothetical protein
MGDSECLRGVEQTMNFRVFIINVFAEYTKNGKRYLRQAESSAIRFLIIAEAFKRMAASHVHTRLPVLYPEDQLSVSLSSVSTRIAFTILAFFRTRCL